MKRNVLLISMMAGLALALALLLPRLAGAEQAAGSEDRASTGDCPMMGSTGDCPMMGSTGDCPMMGSTGDMAMDEDCPMGTCPMMASTTMEPKSVLASRDALALTAPQVAEIERLASDLAARRSEAMELMAEAHEGVRTVLTPAQREQLADLADGETDMSRCMQAMQDRSDMEGCPMMHGGGSSPSGATEEKEAM